MTTRRIATFAGVLNLDPERIRDWALAQAVLSAWWSIEDNDDPAWIASMVGFAELLATLPASELRPG
jgi:streptomycin 6-kinase